MQNFDELVFKLTNVLRNILTILREHALLIDENSLTNWQQFVKIMYRQKLYYITKLSLPT